MGNAEGAAYRVCASVASTQLVPAAARITTSSPSLTCFACTASTAQGFVRTGQRLKGDQDPGVPCRALCAFADLVSDVAAPEQGSTDVRQVSSSPMTAPMLTEVLRGVREVPGQAPSTRPGETPTLVLVIGTVPQRPGLSDRSSRVRLVMLRSRAGHSLMQGTHLLALEEGSCLITIRHLSWRVSGLLIGL